MSEAEALTVKGNNKKITKSKHVYIQAPGGFSRGGYGKTLELDDCLKWYCRSSCPRADIDKHVPALRNKARDLYISSTLVSAAVNTRVAGAIGAGLALDAQPDAAALKLSAADADAADRRIERAFARWAAHAGLNGESLNEIVHTVALACLNAGDCFVDVHVYGDAVRLEVIEADRVETPEELATDEKITGGVVTSSAGRPVAYYVADRYTSAGMTDYTRRGAFWGGYFDGVDDQYHPATGGVLHVHMPFERPGQKRGLPIVSKVLAETKLLDRYKLAEIDAAAVSASAALLITHPAADYETANDYADSFTYAEAEAKPVDEIVHPEINLKPGAAIHLEPGADVRSFNTNRPNTAFSAFCDAADARICSALGLPAEVVQKRYDSSYSASRAARLDADLTYRQDRARIVEQLLEPVYHAWLDFEAERLGLTAYAYNREANDAWRGFAFLGESVPSIDPEKEVNAAISAINAGLSTRQAEARKLYGADAANVIRTLANEEQQMRAAGLVKDQNGVPIEPTEK